MGQKVRFDTALAVLSIGILELLVGLCILISCIVFQGKLDTSVLVPYWAAVPLLLCGILGIVAGATKNKCAVIGYLVISIIMTIIMFLASGLVAIVSAIYNIAIDYLTQYDCYTENENCKCYTNAQRTSTKTYDGTTCGRMKAIGGLLKIIAGLSVVGGLLCLAGCISSCAALCCLPEEPTVIVTHQHPNAVVIHQQPPPAQESKPAVEEVQPGY